MRIYIDAMGGDNAPCSTIGGAIKALDHFPKLKIVLAGDKLQIQNELKNKDYDEGRLSIDECSEIISNNESPVMAIRRKNDSAIVKGMLALREKSVDAFLSAGSTGAVLAGSMFRLGRIEGIDRPAIGTLIPNTKSFSMLIDSGANVDCLPEYLLQFANMGQAYMRGVMNVDSPRIGLINIGAEEEKGDELRKSAYQLLKNSKLNFIGNVEARDIPNNLADVLVCDGFVGNVVLKYTEGVSVALMSMLKKEIFADKRSKVGAMLAKPAFKRFKTSLDYSEIGGAPLLGVNGAVIKAHGSSNAHSIYSAIKQAVKMIEADVPELIRQNL